MKAYVLNRHGDSSVLKLSEMEIPEPKKGQVRVKIQSIGLNYAEIQSRKGVYGWAPKMPYTLGMEAYGIVDAIGEECNNHSVGDAVIVTTQFGTYAEYICVKERLLTPAIQEFSPEENAATAVNFATAWVALFEMGRVRPGESVLIHAAAGGVGTAAVQLAKAYGCKVFGTVSRDEKKEILNRFDPDGIINYSRDDFEKVIREMNNGQGVDMVLEVVGGDVFKKSMRLLNPFGRTVVIGFASLNFKKWNPLSWVRTLRDIPRVKVNNLAIHSSGIMSSHLGYLLNDSKRMKRMLSEMTAFMQEHSLKPVVGKVYDFDQLPAAHDWIESRKSVGKIIVNI